MGRSKYRLTIAKATARLAAAPSEAWKANAVSRALAAAIKQTNAAAEKNAVRPASPWVIHFMDRDWFICRFSLELRPSISPDFAADDLIEINTAFVLQLRKPRRGCEADQIVEARLS